MTLPDFRLPGKILFPSQANGFTDGSEASDRPDVHTLFTGADVGYRGVMGVNWDNVERPETDDEEEEDQGTSPLVTVFFVLLGLAALVGGAAFLNVTVLGNRIKQRAIDDCDGPACILEVRTTHDDCFSSRMVFGMPSGMNDFQTPRSANNLGFISIDYADYAVCAGVVEEEPS